MKRHTTLLSTLFLALAVSAACSSGSAEEGTQGGEATARAAEGAAPGAQAGTPSDQELSCFLRGATPEEAQGRPSPLRELRFTLAGGGEALLCYGAPSARGREIMGGLVPFDRPWRAGANEATAIHLTGAASIGGVEVQPGSYSLYTIPGEEEWQIFLNSNWQRWGIPINDAVRETEIGSVTVATQALDQPVESLTFRHEDGAIVMEWENTRVSIPVGPPEA